MKVLMFLLLTISLTTNAQDWEVPENYILNDAKDYKKYEEDVIKATNWIIKTPIEEEKEKRKNTNLFLMKWLTGSPTVSIALDAKVATFIDGGADYLMVFMAGWAKYVLENNYTKDAVQGNIAGIKSVIDFYRKNKDTLGRNKDIESYIKLEAKGKLQSTLEKRVAKQ